MVAITRSKLEYMIYSEKKSLKEIGEEVGVTTGYLSQLCTRWNITPPKPGRKKGSTQTEETKEKIRDYHRRRRGEK